MDKVYAWYKNRNILIAFAISIWATVLFFNFTFKYVCFLWADTGSVFLALAGIPLVAVTLIWLIMSRFSLPALGLIILLPGLGYGATKLGDGLAPYIFWSLKKDKCEELEKKTTWFSADKALEWGLVDSIE